MNEMARAIKPDVSVIIPTKNRCESLRKCLDSLLMQKYRNFEVVVVDGGSTDGTIDLVTEYMSMLAIRLIGQKRKGLVNAVNEGWIASHGEIVVRTDDDIVADAGWLLEIVKTFRSSTTIGGVTGPTIIPEELKGSRDVFYFQNKMRSAGNFWSLLGIIYFYYFLEGRPTVIGQFFRSGAFSLGSNYSDCLRLTKAIDVDHHEACNMAVKRDQLEEIGGFDEIYLGVGEYSEADVSFKIRKLGYRIVFNPKALVYHLTSKEGVFGERSSSYGRVLNFINFYFKHIKPDTLDKFVRFYCYLLFLNGYWIYKFVITRKKDQLGCLIGTAIGLARNVLG